MNGFWPKTLRVLRTGRHVRLKLMSLWKMRGGPALFVVEISAFDDDRKDKVPMPEPNRSVVAFDQLPSGFPTQMHAPAFWEALGRAVATFGFLEETLGKAIFAYTGMRQIPEEQINAAYEKWTLTLQHALSDALGGLIDTYGKAVRDHGGATVENLDVLIDRLEEAARRRNVLCHGSWNKKPDAEGRSIPFFVTGLGEKQRKCDTPIDIAYLQQVQRDVAELACEVINTVTYMGWQFPGSRGPGISVWPSKGGAAG
jgi:hypothetical protein